MKSYIKSSSAKDLSSEAAQQHHIYNHFPIYTSVKHINHRESECAERRMRAKQLKSTFLTYREREYELSRILSQRMNNSLMEKTYITTRRKTTTTAQRKTTLRTTSACIIGLNECSNEK